MSRKHVVAPEKSENAPEIPDQEQSDDDWRDQLLLLQAMPPDAFERLSRRILRESGFIKVEVKGKSGDGGIDGIGVLRVNLLSFQVFFQCKRYKRQRRRRCDSGFSRRHGRPHGQRLVYHHRSFHP
jgi:restriction system protein